MGVAKVVLNGDTLIDTTGKTIAADKMLAPYTALDKAGNNVTGNIATKTSSDLTVSGATVTAPAGFYASAASKSVSSMTLPTSASATSSGTSKATISRSTSAQYINIPTGYNSTASYYTISAVPNGTAGTPTATKGTVSNHQISITPSVTNTTGYITGSTKNGPAVTVTASELASGSKSISANGTGIDVVGYSTVDVAVPSTDFIITVSYNSTTQQWEPDCTFAEYQTAYNAGKTITVQTDDGEDASADGARFAYARMIYFVRQYKTESYHGQTREVIHEYSYFFTANGVDIDDDYVYIEPSGTLPISQNGTGIDVAAYANVDVAVPSDVYVLHYGFATFDGPVTFVESYADTKAAIQNGKAVIFMAGGVLQAGVIEDVSTTSFTFDGITFSEGIRLYVSAYANPDEMFQVAWGYVNGSITTHCVQIGTAVPTGTISITTNGTVNVSAYEYANVSVSGGSTPDGNNYDYGTTPRTSPYVNYGQADYTVLR